ncbi:MAG: Carbohydrate family 9 binding domain-like [Clostridia bacterium]|nr:Carbohydrate family 9 binding domain-like [Clostridia bacterium]
MKKLLTVILIAAFLASFALVTSAASFNAPNLKPVLDGKFSEDEWKGAQKITLDKTTSATWGGNAIAIEDRVVDWYFAWDAEGLYMAVITKGDTTPYQTSDAEVWFPASDSIQVAFNPDLSIVGAQPMFFSIGAPENAVPVTYKHYYDSTLGLVNDRGIQGISTKNDGTGYIMEMMFPWSVLKTAGDMGGIPGDFTNWKTDVGTKIGLLLVCCDATDAGSLYFRSDAVEGTEPAWNADELTLSIELGAAPVVEEPVPEVVEEVVDENPVTSDINNIYALLMFISIITFAVILKTRKVNA